MYKTKAERAEFWSQKQLTPVERFLDCAPNKAYKLEKTGHHVYEIEINSGLNLKETVEIAQLTDLHFHYVSEDDWDDDEIMYTAICRKWLANGWSIRFGINALNAASFTDQIVVTGDTLDYHSKGAMQMMNKYIWDAYPEVMCTLGGHELTKQMETKLPDRTPLEDRLHTLEKFWRHDMHYFSKLVKDSVLCVCLDNSRGHYNPVTAQKLKADIALAKEKGYVILLFQHEPMSTGKESDREVAAYFNGNSPVYNYYDGQNLNCAPQNMNDDDKEVYNIITSNADVIKGVFNGHLHSGYYTEIKASYTDEAGTHEAVIPQVTTSTPIWTHPKGCITRIIVK